MLLWCCGTYDGSTFSISQIADAENNQQKLKKISTYSTVLKYHWGSYWYSSFTLHFIGKYSTSHPTVFMLEL